MQSAGNSEDGGSGWGSYYRSIAGYPSASDDSQLDTPKEKGARRKKFAGYLKTANELRQSYIAGYNSAAAKDMDKDIVDSSGEQPENGWPSVEIVRRGDEELVLFPSYARSRDGSFSRNDASGHNLVPESGAAGHARAPSIQEDWLTDDPPSEEDKNVVDVDVRGWLFAPHSGTLSRKNRYALWMIRQLCGLPSQVPAQAASPEGNPTAAEAHAVSQAATLLENTGKFSNRPPPTYSDEGSTNTNAQSQSQSQMTQAEIASAHEALTKRIAPFMYNPIPQSPVTIFFYNSTTSQSRSLLTSDSGHFSVRASLPFIPTHVRVLASEMLSATEEVIIHDPFGVSLISDIDDTVKHSAVSLGAREIFRNTFTAPLKSLTIPGVASWYNTLVSPPYNISIHYVSNSPWQLYPFLKNFFQEAGLPAGSFHLKQYSGMLQGIFEPVVDRKRATVEKVVEDFPHRRWVLVGDSGEADLEVYCEIVEKWPERILGVYIRDVTTSRPDLIGKFFDSNEARNQTGIRKTETGSTGLREVEMQDFERPPQKSPRPIAAHVPEGNLIDFSEDRGMSRRPVSTPITSDRQRRESATSMLSTSASSTGSRRTPPPRPKKPKELMGTPLNPPSVSAMDIGRRPVPPVKCQTDSQLGPAISLQRKIGESSTSLPQIKRASTSTSVYDGHEYGPASPPAPMPLRVNSTFSAASVDKLDGQGSSQGQQELLPKKEELWRRRWARAQEILGAKGIPLCAWRVGSDVEAHCQSLVARAVKENEEKKGGLGVRKERGWRRDDTEQVE